MTKDTIPHEVRCCIDDVHFTMAEFKSELDRKIKHNANELGIQLGDLQEKLEAIEARVAVLEAAQP